MFVNNCLIHVFNFDFNPKHFAKLTGDIRLLALERSDNTTGGVDPGPS